jgi:hypothetical protein
LNQLKSEPPFPRLSLILGNLLPIFFRHFSLPPTLDSRTRIEVCAVYLRAMRVYTGRRWLFGVVFPIKIELCVRGWGPSAWCDTARRSCIQSIYRTECMLSIDLPMIYLQESLACLRGILRLPRRVIPLCELSFRDSERITVGGVCPLLGLFGFECFNLIVRQ